MILVLMSHRSHGFFSLQQRFVYHQDSVSTILLVVTPISFEKSYIWFLIAVSLWTYRFFNHHVFLKKSSKHLSIIRLIIFLSAFLI